MPATNQKVDLLHTVCIIMFPSMSIRRERPSAPDRRKRSSTETQRNRSSTWHVSVSPFGYVTPDAPLSDVGQIVTSLQTLAKWRGVKSLRHSRRSLSDVGQIVTLLQTLAKWRGSNRYVALVFCANIPASFSLCWLRTVWSDILLSPGLCVVVLIAVVVRFRRFAPGCI